MSKLLLRIIAILLVPCLMVDPVTASSLSMASVLTSRSALGLSSFAEQALSLRAESQREALPGGGVHGLVAQMRFHFPSSFDPIEISERRITLYRGDGTTFERDDTRFLGPVWNDVEEFVGEKKQDILHLAQHPDQQIVFCLPTYKSADRIGHKLENLVERFEELKQGRPQWGIRLVVGVNGATPEEVASLSRLYQRWYRNIGISLDIMTIPLPGQNHALNVMTSYAQQEHATVLAFLNDDVDYAIPGRFEDAIDRLLSSGELGVVGAPHLVSEDVTRWQRLVHTVRGRIFNVIPNGALTVMYADTYPGIPEYMASNELFLAAYFLKLQLSHELDRILMLTRVAYVRRFPEFWQKEYRRLMRKALAQIQIAEAFPQKVSLLNRGLEERHDRPLAFRNWSDWMSWVVFIPQAALYYGTRWLAYLRVSAEVRWTHLRGRSFSVSPWWPYGAPERGLSSSQKGNSDAYARPPGHRPPSELNLPMQVESYTTDEEDVGEASELFGTSIYPSYVGARLSGSDIQLQVDRHGLVVAPVPKQYALSVSVARITNGSFIAIRSMDPDHRPVLAVAHVNQGTGSRDHAWTTKILNAVANQLAERGHTAIQAIVLYDPGTAAWTERPEIESRNRNSVEVCALRQRHYPVTRARVTAQDVTLTYESTDGKPLKSETVHWKIPESRLSGEPNTSPETKKLLSRGFLLALQQPEPGDSGSMADMVKVWMRHSSLISWAAPAINVLIWGLALSDYGPHNRRVTVPAHPIASIYMVKTYITRGLALIIYSFAFTYGVNVPVDLLWSMLTFGFFQVVFRSKLGDDLKHDIENAQKLLPLAEAKLELLGGKPSNFQVKALGYRYNLIKRRFEFVLWLDEPRFLYVLGLLLPWAIYVYPTENWQSVRDVIRNWSATTRPVLGSGPIRYERMGNVLSAA